LNCLKNCSNVNIKCGIFEAICDRRQAKKQTIFSYNTKFFFKTMLNISVAQTIQRISK